MLPAGFVQSGQNGVMSHQSYDAAHDLDWREPIFRRPMTLFPTSIILRLTDSSRQRHLFWTKTQLFLPPTWIAAVLAKSSEGRRVL
jgi:hypothetical protein